MNQKFNVEPIRQMLNRSSARLDQPTLAKLRAARAQAVARYDARNTAPALAPSFAWPGALVGSGHAAGSHRSRYYWVSAVLLAAILFSAVGYWQHLTEHDNSDVDIAILTDDLPLDAYVE